MARQLIIATACIFVVSISSLGQYQVNVSEISVWVRALDSSGNPVRGMTRDDFEVLENGKVQPLTCFKEVDFADDSSFSRREEQVDVTARLPKRGFVLFLDLLNTTPAEFLRLRPLLTTFLQQLQRQKSQIMLAALTQQGKLGVIAPLTSDVGRIQALLLKAPANGMRDARERNNLNNIRYMLEKAKQDPQFRDVLIRRAFEMARSYARDEERNSELSIEALESFAAYLRKQREPSEQTIIIFISGGFQADPGRRYYEAIHKFLEREEGSSAMGSFSSTSFDVRLLVKKSVGKLNKMDMTIYSINTRGMHDGSDNISVSSPELAEFSNTYLQDYQESLAQLADETGGKFFQNSNNFKKGLDLIFDDLSHQYELCYAQPAHVKPGQYHKIQVRVKRKGVQIRHRLGYVD